MAFHFFFSYIGAKWNESKRLYDLIDFEKNNIDTIVEPFCGSCSFSLYGVIKNDIVDKKYILNDIDSRLMKFLSHVKEGKLKSYIDYTNKNGQKYYDNLELWHKDCKNQEKLNMKKWYMIRRLKHGSMLYHYNKNKEHNQYEKQEYKNYSKHNDFFKNDNVLLTNEDYLTCMNKFKDMPNALLFLDPPYLDSYNASYISYISKKYNSFVTDHTQMYIDILNFFDTCKCKVIMIITKNAITSHLFGKYEIATYEKIYQLTKKKVIHMIIYK